MRYQLSAHTQLHSDCFFCFFKISAALIYFLLLIYIGISSINMDIKSGMLLVSGFVDPVLLQKEIEKIGKKAELLAYEKDPNQAKAKKKLNQLFWKMHQDHHQDHEDRNRCTYQRKDEDKENNCWCNNGSSKDVPKLKVIDLEPLPRPSHGMASHHKVPPGPAASGGGGGDGFGWRGQRVDPRFYCGYGGLPPPPPPPPPVYATARPYGYMGIPYGYQGELTPPLLQSSGAALPVPPPPWPQVAPSNVYAVQSGQKDTPAGNSYFHMFSDHNPNACNIM